MNLNVNVKDLTTDLLVRYGFQVLGAIVILAIGFLLARWLAKTADRRFQKQQMEPPMRLLMVRVIKIVVLLMPFRVGEYIEINHVRGEVTVIELSTTTLVQIDHSRVVVPNRKIVGEIVHNYGTMRMLTLAVRVPHNVD